MPGKPLSLQNICKKFVLTNLEQFPVSYLSLLPLSMRQSMLWELAIADVCQLETTAFCSDLDLTSYWKHLAGDVFMFSDNDVKADKNVWKFAEEMGDGAFAKATFYGQVASFLINEDCIISDYWFELGNVRDDDSLIPYLYSIREYPKPSEDWYWKVEIPPRYGDVDKQMEMGEKVDCIIRCFAGQPPTVLMETFLHLHYEIKFECLYFLKNLRFICMYGAPVKHKFLQKIIDVAKNLQVLAIESIGNDSDEEMILDDLSTYLVTCKPFWKNFSVLKLKSRMGVCDAFTIQSENLQKLIATYLSTPADHPQILCFSHLKIITCDPPQRDMSKQPHRHGNMKLKQIHMENCRLVMDHHITDPEVVMQILDPLELDKNNIVCS